MTSIRPLSGRKSGKWAQIQKRVADLNAVREEALKALNLAIVEEEQKKEQAKNNKGEINVN